jgi:hypothetical protein
MGTGDKGRKRANSKKHIHPPLATRRPPRFVVSYPFVFRTPARVECAPAKHLLTNNSL